MSRSSGNYTAPSSSWNPAVEGTVVDETDFNALLDDIEAALTESVYTGGLGSTDNRLVRTDGTDTKKVQASAITVDDSGNMSGVGTIDAAAFTGDSGAGGVKGLVPAPAAGDAAASKFLKADGTWTAPLGSGDVVGPASATNNGFAKFDGTTGKLLKNSAATVAISSEVSGLGTGVATALATPNSANLATAFAVREVLTAARTYYVRTDGSDSNTGLADTAGGAFLTIQAAINAVSLLDFNAKVVTIQVRSGTYAAITLKANTGQALVSDFIIQGDTTTPSNVTISSSGVCVSATGTGVLAQFKGIKITSSGSYGFNCTAGATIQYETMDFGTCGFDHILCQTGAHITASGNYSITAGAGRHLNTIAGGIIRVLSRTLTITGTPAFSTAFAEASELGIMRLVSNTYTGSATGPRYSVTGNSVIQTFGAGATALPGDSAGSTATGGQYL